MASTANVASTQRAGKKYVNLSTMSDDSDDEHFVLPSQRQMSNKYTEKW